MSKFYLFKKQMLRWNCSNYEYKSTFLLQRKNLIEDMKSHWRFANVLKETNEVMKEHLNDNVIYEIRKANAISFEYEQAN